MVWEQAATVRWRKWLGKGGLKNKDVNVHPHTLTHSHTNIYRYRYLNADLDCLT